MLTGFTLKKNINNCLLHVCKRQKFKKQNALCCLKIPVLLKKKECKLQTVDKIFVSRNMDTTVLCNYSKVTLYGTNTQKYTLTHSLSLSLAVFLQELSTSPCSCTKEVWKLCCLLRKGVP